MSRKHRKHKKITGVIISLPIPGAWLSGDRELQRKIESESNKTVDMEHLL